MNSIRSYMLKLASCLCFAAGALAEDASPWPDYVRTRVESVTAAPTFEARRGGVWLQVGYYRVDWKRYTGIQQDPEKWSEYARYCRYYGDEIDLDPKLEYTFEFLHSDRCGEEFDFEHQYHFPSNNMGALILLRILKDGAEIYRPETCFHVRTPEPLPEACDGAQHTTLAAEMKRLLHLLALCEVPERWEYLPAYDPEVSEIKPFCDGFTALAEATRSALLREDTVDTVLLVEQAMHDHTVVVFLIDPLSGDEDTVPVDMYDGNCIDEFYLTPFPIEAKRIDPDVPLFVGTFEEEWAHGTAVTAIYSRAKSTGEPCQRYRANSIYMAFH